VSAHQDSFAGTGVHAGKEITTVWVKAGANFSGDGPGYGQRFDLPVKPAPPRLIIGTARQGY
jgi:hypothetical protein